MRKAQTVSIVIPVFNEENYLKNCLDSIARQTVRPLEVLVVDNNSTDRTTEIAQSYTFVKLLHENKQGQVFAQAKGFDNASGTILGRIDGDSILTEDWVEKVQEHFYKNTDSVAISGSPEPYDIGAKRMGKAIFYFYHYLLSRFLLSSDMLWGANCAFRASAWHKVKDKVTFDRKIWEDYDLSFLLLPLGKIRYVKDLVVYCSFRPVHKPFVQQLEYHMRQVWTFDIHRPEYRYFLVLVVVGSKMIFIYPLTVLDMHIFRPLSSKLAQLKTAIQEF
jgi:glycosyltransferase involved in cell wall biosynthesis